jgi:hypothetical protein
MHLQSLFSPYAAGKKKPVTTTHTPQWSDYWCVCQRKYATTGQKTSKQDRSLSGSNWRFSHAFFPSFFCAGKPTIYHERFLQPTHPGRNVTFHASATVALQTITYIHSPSLVFTVKWFQNIYIQECRFSPHSPCAASAALAGVLAKCSQELIRRVERERCPGFWIRATRRQKRYGSPQGRKYAYLELKKQHIGCFS